MTKFDFIATMRPIVNLLDFLDSEYTLKMNKDGAHFFFKIKGGVTKSFSNNSNYEEIENTIILLEDLLK